jgi:oxygen-independent coproporphyrinogen-3 oxidase
MNSRPARAAYIHVPFCRHHCGYCNFTVVAGRNDLVEPLLAAIATELGWLGQSREVDTLYFGGGTPTYLPPTHLKRLSETVLHWHPLADGYEWTVEANPGDVDTERLAVLAEAGVNRLSLGGQSFNRQKLTLLERSHDALDIERAVFESRKARMAVSLDLIFGVPGETLVDWQADLRKTLDLAPDHVSTYGLTFEKGTQFWNRKQRGELVEIDEGLERDMYLAAIDMLTAEGFEHYEVSNFAGPECRSRHNETYWSGRSYFAAGPGASRYVDGRRETNHPTSTACSRASLRLPRKNASTLSEGHANSWFLDCDACRELNAASSLCRPVGNSTDLPVRLFIASSSLECCWTMASGYNSLVKGCS